MLTNIDHEIIGYMARTLWLNIYADACDSGDIYRYLAERAGYKVEGSEDPEYPFQWKRLKGIPFESTEVFTTEDEAWEDACAHAGIAVDTAGPGGDWADVAPPTPDRCLHLAYHMAGEMTVMNHDTLFFLARKAAIADIAYTLYRKNSDCQEDCFKIAGQMMEDSDFDQEHLRLLVQRRGCTYLEDFGHCIVMQILGTGVSWTDGHADIELKTDHWETPDLWSIDWNPETVNH